MIVCDKVTGESATVAVAAIVTSALPEAERDNLRVLKRLLA